MRSRNERWLVAVLLLMSGTYAVAEDLGLMTTYPSPRGIYQGLRVRGSAPITSIPRLVLSTPGTASTDESALDLFSLDANGNGVNDIGDKLWQISARGNQFSAVTERNDLMFWKWNQTAWNAPFMIDFATGNVSIAPANAAQTDPSQRLTLNSGNIRLPNANVGIDGNLYFGGVTDLGQVGFRLFGGLVNGVTPAGYMDVKSTDPNDGLRIRVDTVDGSTQRMIITAGGNVGIGSTVPSNTLDVDGPIEIGDWIETSNPSNRFRFCGSALITSTNPATCGAASELIAGRIRLSADGSFANAEAQTDPGLGGINAPGNVIVGGKLGVGPPFIDPSTGLLTSKIPGAPLDVDGNMAISGKLTVNTAVDVEGNISAAGNLSGAQVNATTGFCIRGDCRTNWGPPTTCPAPNPAVDTCTWRKGGGCSDPMPRRKDCLTGEYVKRIRLKVVGGCGDDKDDLSIDVLCCKFLD